MKARWLIAAVAVAAAGCGATRQVRAPRLPADVPPFPFAQLARGKLPTSAVWTSSRHLRAVEVTMGAGVRGNEPVAVAVLRGHFTDDLASRPYGVKAPTGTVETIVYDMSTGTSRDFGLGDRPVRLGRLGAVHDFLPYLRLAATKSRAASMETQWLEAVATGERSGCATHYANRARPDFARRLRADAERAGAHVESLQFLHACQDAPVVVLESSDRGRLARALARILDDVDAPRNGARRYEASFFELVDGHGKPFAIAYDTYRGRVEGTQWAASPGLFPFPHG
jgi:hypothetical protein